MEIALALVLGIHHIKRFFLQSNLSGLAIVTQLLNMQKLLHDTSCARSKLVIRNCWDFGMCLRCRQFRAAPGFWRSFVVSH